MRIILLGAPGSGKGTQSKCLSGILSVPVISTGDILRKAMKKRTSAGIRARTYIEEGRLVPDDIIIDIVSKRLEEPDCSGGYILDGVPRTITQAETLEAAGLSFDYVVFIEVSDEKILGRIEGRRVCERCGATYHLSSESPKTEGICDCCGGNLIRRKDDDPKIVRTRLQTYHRETEPLLAFYRSRHILRPVHTDGTIKESTEMILRKIGVNK